MCKHFLYSLRLQKKQRQGREKHFLHILDFHVLCLYFLGKRNSAVYFRIQGVPFFHSGSVNV
jgi:hypothetical protein